MAGPGKLSWDSVEVWQKLVAAIIASGVKIDVSNVATHFGTTYDTIENRLRPIKKQAKVLQDAVSSGTQDKVTSTRKSPTKPRTPKKAVGVIDGVSSGRVAKGTPSGKASKKKNATLKQEAVDFSFASMAEQDSLDDGFSAADFETSMSVGDMFE